MNFQRNSSILKKLSANKRVITSMIVPLTLLIVLSTNLYSQSKKPSVGFLSLKPLVQFSNEQNSAFKALNAVVDTANSIILIDQLSDPGIISGKNILWYHKPDSSEFDKSLVKKKVVEAIRAYVLNGGTLLLTLDAVRYVNLLGVEPNLPERIVRKAIDEGYGRKLGFHAYHEHPLFDGMFGGAYIFNPKIDTSFVLTGYFGTKIPAGSVIGINWAHINFEESTKLVWEYTLGKGKILCIGGYTLFDCPNFNSLHLLRFLENSLNYLNGGAFGKKTEFWSFKQRTISPFAQQSDTFKVPTPIGLLYGDDPLSIVNREGGEDPWNVAGNRMVCMGKEKGGIEEIWAHPFMALRDYEVGIIIEGAHEPVWLNTLKPVITVKPACFNREYLVDGKYLKESIITSSNKTATLIRYEYRGDKPASIVVKYNTSLRQMWPYSEKTGGDIGFAWDLGLKAHVIKDSVENSILILGADRLPSAQLCGQFSNFNFNNNVFSPVKTNEFMVSALLKYELQNTDNLCLAISASDDGWERTKTAYIRALKDPAKFYINTKKYWEEVVTKNLTISSPNADFDKGYRWALIGTAKSMVYTNAIGTSYIAGYGPTSKGWDGGHKVSGRPGYAWYFGRDALWSGMAIVDYGDFTGLNLILNQFLKYQDLNGKIYHELTTSGTVYYDAADATPLFLMLSGKYLRQTGNGSWLRQNWPRIKLAIDYCFSTDTDGDHLIENTNVGHGWIEGGKLYGEHSSLYLASLWAGALRECYMMASYLQKDSLARSYMDEGMKVSKIINQEFWNEETGFYSDGKLKDGSYEKEPTVLCSTFLLQKMAEPQKAEKVLRSFAGNGFSTDWGMRMLKETSPLYDPNGYHYGTVWPLFTGWTSLAEYAYFRPVQGYTHLMNNLLIHKNFAKGFVEEVMNGEKYEPSGFCPQQCWSETMVLQPAIEGMLGYQAIADFNQVQLVPAFPADWDTVAVKNIKVASERVSMFMKRHDGTYVYSFESESKTTISIRFAPRFLPGATVESFKVNGNPDKGFRVNPENGVSGAILFDLNQFGNVEIITKGGVSIIPSVPDPGKNYVPEHFRIIGDIFRNNTYEIETEGLSGTSKVIQVYNLQGKPLQIENAQFVSQSGNIMSLQINFEKSDVRYTTKTVKLVFQGQ